MYTLCKAIISCNTQFHQNPQGVSSGSLPYTPYHLMTCINKPT